MRDMALQNAAGGSGAVTFEHVAEMAARPTTDGQTMRSSIEKLADREESWFRSTPSHALATDKVMNTRVLELRTLNDTNLAFLAALEFGPEAAADRASAAAESLQARLQASVRSIDSMPGSTKERSSQLQYLRTQLVSGDADAAFMDAQLGQAQRVYLDHFRQERLAIYTSLPRSDDLDLSH